METIIPVEPGTYLLAATDDFTGFEKHTVIGIVNPNDGRKPIKVITYFGQVDLLNKRPDYCEDDFRRAVMRPDGAVEGLVGVFDSPDAWLSATREAGLAW